MRRRFLTVVVSWALVAAGGGSAAQAPTSVGTASVSQSPPPASSATPATSQFTQTQPALELKLPLEPKSVRFAVIGDSGTGEAEQYEVAREMESYRQVVRFDFVIMLGDNIYGGHRPQDFVRKFELP